MKVVKKLNKVIKNIKQNFKLCDLRWNGCALRSSDHKGLYVFCSIHDKYSPVYMLHYAQVSVSFIMLSTKFLI